MDAIITQEAVDTSRVPGVTLAEFGKRDFDGKTKDELAGLEAEINRTLTGQPAAPVPGQVYEPTAGQPAPTPAPAQAQTPAPVGPPPAPAPVEVPPKFANPDGTLNQDKLEKSFVNLEAYLQRERELTQLKQQPQPPMPVQPQYPQQNLYAPPQGQFEQQVNEGMRQDPGLTAINLASAAVIRAQAYADAQNRELRSRLELMEMGQSDPAVFTAEGLAKLTEIRKQNPWLDAAPNPWYAAYKLSGGIAPRSAPAPQPAQPRQAAPIVPGGQAPAGAPGSSAPLTSEGDLRRALEARYPKDPASQYRALEEILARQARGG